MLHLKTLVIASFFALAFGQPQPNFSGTWKLNVSDSDYTDKRVVVQDSLIWKIEIRGDRLKYTVEGQRQGKKSGFTADIEIGGAPFESDEAGIISVHRKGNSLIVDTLYNPDNDRRSSMQEIWTISDDGRKLSDSVVFHVPKSAKNPADVVFKRMFDRQ